MKKEKVLSPSGRHYAEAYKEQYAMKDLHSALLIYSEIVVEYPESMEAGYSKSQIQNIARSVVPGEVLYEAELHLALNHSEHDNVPDNSAVTARSPVPELPN